MRSISRAPRPDDPRVRFLVELSRALGTYGTAAHRLEAAVSLCAHEFGFECHVFSTPTSVLLSVEIDGSHHSYLSRIVPGEVNLSKLRRFDELFNAVIAGRVSPKAGVQKIKQIVHERDPIAGWMHVLSIALVSASAAVFLGGGLREIGTASMIGGTVGVLGLFVGKNREYARLMEFLAGLVAAAIAWLMTLVIGPYAPPIAMIAGIIFLIPGLTLTMSMTELATRNVVSGSARLIGALMIFLLMGFGAAVGNQAVHAFFVLPESIEPTRLGEGWNILAAFVASLLFVVLFRAKWSDAIGMVLAVFVSFYSSRFGSEHFGLEFGVCFAALCVGALGNLYARVMDRPSAIVLLPGLLMLVPGSVGFRSLQLLMDQDTIMGMQSAFTVLILGSALVVGLLLSNVIVPPRKVL